MIVRTPNISGSQDAKVAVIVKTPNISGSQDPKAAALPLDPETQKYSGSLQSS